MLEQISKNQKNLDSYTWTAIFFDVIIGLSQNMETICDVLYLVLFPFHSKTLYYLAFGFLLLNPLAHIVFVQIRLFEQSGFKRIYLGFKEYGFFYDKVQIDDCGYFTKVSKVKNSLGLACLYCFSPVLLVYLVFFLVVNVVYNVINYIISIFLFLIFVFIITILAALFSILKLDLIFYPACIDLVSIAYFSNSRCSNLSNYKMINIKRICIIFHLLLEGIPQCVIQILNNYEENLFELVENNFKKIVLLGSLIAGSVNLFFSIGQIINLRIYKKEKYSPLRIFRSSIRPKDIRSTSEIIVSGENIEINV